MAKIYTYTAYFDAKKKRDELKEQADIRSLTDEEIQELGQLIVDIQEFKDIIMNYD